MAKVEFLSPVGRMVQGDPFEASTTDQQGNPRLIKSGPNAGKPTQQFFIAVAFPKVVNGQPNAEFGALWALLDGVAKASFPAINIAPPWDPACRFSWKVIDGDGIDTAGKPNNQKEGFAGHWVVRFASSFAPRCFHAGRYQPHEQIQDKNAIPRGYFVRVAGTIEGNGNAQKPGLFVNLSMVELVGIGPIIVTGPDAATIFGGAPAPLPAGAQPLPMLAGSVAPAGHSLPLPGAPMGAPNLPQPLGLTLPANVGAFPSPSLPMAAVGLPQAPAGIPGLPTPQPVAVAPHPGILAGPAGIPGLPLGMVPVPAAPAYQMTAAAQGYTRDQYAAQGWTDDQLRGAGMML